MKHYNLVKKIKPKKQRGRHQETKINKLDNLLSNKAIEVYQEKVYLCIILHLYNRNLPNLD